MAIGQAWLGTKHLSCDHSTLNSLSLKMSASEIGQLSDKDLAKIAIEEVNEDPDRIVSDIQMIKEWLEKQPHLQNICKGSLFSFAVVKRHTNSLFSYR